MTNQTTRIPASKVIIGPFVERRIQKAHKWKTKLSGMIINLTGNRRNPKHNYTNPPQLFNVFIPVDFPDYIKPMIEEAEQEEDYQLSIRYFERGHEGPGWYLYYHDLPDEGGDKIDTLHSPNDQIVFGDEWFESRGLFFIKSLFEKPINGEYNWQPPSTMPDHLNTFTVLKVLGCELRNKKWHFNYLMRKEVKEWGIAR